MKYFDSLLAELRSGEPSKPPKGGDDHPTPNAEEPSKPPKGGGGPRLAGRATLSPLAAGGVATRADRRSPAEAQRPAWGDARARGTGRVAWEGGRLDGDMLGIHFEAADEARGDSLSMRIATASGVGGRIVPGPRIGEFVRLHRDREFVVHDVAAGFWAVADLLAARREVEARDAWWSIADEGRLHDLSLLDQLIALARTDAEPRPRALAEIVAEHGGSTGESKPRPDPASAALAVYPAMLGLALELTDSYRGDIRADAVEKYGVLTQAIQVKAAIALAAVSRHGLLLDVKRLDAARSRLGGRVSSLVESIRGLPGCERLFRAGADGRPLRTATGAPSLDVEVLRRVLARAADEVAADSGRPVSIPRTSSGWISTSTGGWEALAASHPIIAHWLELERASAVLRSAVGLVGPVIRPTYKTLVRTGRCAASGPNIQGLPRRGGIREAFIPRPGRLFLIVDYICAELRTLASICEARYGSSKLAEVFRAGGDPHAHTAALLEGMEPSRFAGLRGGSPRDREVYEELRRRAKAVSFGIPGGLGAAALATYARSNYKVAMTTDEAVDLRRRLTTEIYPELGAYLADAKEARGGTPDVPPGVATPTGRIRGIATYCQARNAPFQGLAADAAKLALWDLIREGFRVVAFVHDEYLIELPEHGVDHLAEAGRIAAVLNEAMESATPGVPSACEFALARRWSKDAGASYSPDGRLVCWDEPEGRRA